MSSEQASAEQTSPLTMTREEVARAFQISLRQVDRLSRDGGLPKPFRVGSAVRFLRREVYRQLGVETRV